MPGPEENQRDSTFRVINRSFPLPFKRHESPMLKEIADYSGIHYTILIKG
jgi:hypothetical protein